MAEEKSGKQVNALAVPARKAIPPFEALRAFDTVARLGGIRKAAQNLQRDHAVISRHLKTVEDWTGGWLIERTPSGIVLTEEGVRYHEQISQAIDAIAHATIDLMKRGDHYLLYSWCMPALALQWLMPRLAEFEDANSDLDFELRPADTMPDLERHEADVDIRLVYSFGSQPALPSSIRQREILRPPTVPVASPGYLEAHAPIRNPADLLDGHHLLHEENVNVWAVWLHAQGVPDEIELSGPRLWQGHLTLDAARRDRGIALTNHLVAADDLASGDLVEVGCSESSFRPISLGSYMFMARADRWNAWAIRRFRQWLIRTMRKEFADNSTVAADDVIPAAEAVESRYYSLHGAR